MSLDVASCGAAALLEGEMFRRGELFWGPLLILLGVLFFLNAGGYLPGDVFSWFWPFFFIAIGAWILSGAFNRPQYETVEKFSIPLEGASEASLTINHGAGQIDLQAGANPGDFLTGTSGTGMEKKSRLVGGRLDVKIEAGPSFLPFLGPEGGIWQYRLTPDVPVSIKVEAGASRLDVDLTDLRATYFSFNGGAADLNLTLPARVESALVDIDAGAASIDIYVPQGVALRFRTKSVGSLHIDGQRFPQREPGIYQSAEYETCKYHAEITVDGGATSVAVH
jgi:hypothetical protein